MIGGKNALVIVPTIYAVVAALWITLSSALVRLLMPENLSDRIEDLKGIAFVLVTSALLWLLLRHEFDRIEHARQDLDAAHQESVHLTRQVTQAARMESVGRLAAGVAHDFNNVLTAIFGYNELMLRSHPDLRESEEAVELRNAVEHARQLIAQLMTLSRPAPTNQQVRDLNDCLRRSQPLLTRLLPRHVRLQLDLDPEAMPIRVDLQELEQCLLNLVANAVDAMPGGGVVRLSTSYDDGSLSHVLLTVEDTGTGIEPDHLTLIFDPFFTTKEPGKGTGLGLASVYSIMSRSGATVDVRSNPGQGTSFLFRLPLVAGERQEFSS